MAVNVALVHPTTNQPIPLPSEKTFLTQSHTSISLCPTPYGPSTVSPTSVKGKTPASVLTDGTAYVTSHRLIWISSSSASHTDTDSGATYRSLTVPWTHHLDGRFVQPWFSPNTHEFHLLPIQGGGLDTYPDQDQGDDDVVAGGGRQHVNLWTVQLGFCEGGGFAFHSAIEEAKRLALEDNVQIGIADSESLPMYEEHVASDQSAVATTTDDHNALLHATEPDRSLTTPSTSGGGDVGGGRRARRPTMPDHDLLEAAQVARHQESTECSSQQSALLTSSPPPDDAPPGYELCR